MTTVDNQAAIATDAPTSGPSSGSALLEWLEGECFDLRCEDSPTGGGDDVDVIWIVYSHHMAKPALRPEGYGRTASEAIKDAMLPKGDPRRWDYVPDFSEEQNKL